MGSRDGNFVFNELMLSIYLRTYQALLGLSYN